MSTFDNLVNQITGVQTLAPAATVAPGAVSASTTSQTRNEDDTKMEETASSTLPFGFSTVEEAQTGAVPSSAAPFPTAEQTAAATATSTGNTCLDNCRQEAIEAEKVCDIMRQRVALWLQQNNCPSKVTSASPLSFENRCRSAGMSGIKRPRSECTSCQPGAWSDSNAMANDQPNLPAPVKSGCGCGN